MGIRTFAVTALGTLLISGAAFAADAPAPAASAPQGKHHPSAAAVSACAGKSEGAAVSWTGRKGQARTGKCVMRHGTLAARPDHVHAPRPAASAPAA